MAPGARRAGRRRGGDRRSRCGSGAAQPAAAGARAAAGAHLRARRLPALRDSSISPVVKPGSRVVAPSTWREPSNSPFSTTARTTSAGSGRRTAPRSRAARGRAGADRGRADHDRTAPAGPMRACTRSGRWPARPSSTSSTAHARAGVERGAAARTCGCSTSRRCRPGSTRASRALEDLRVPHRQCADGLGVPAPLRLARSPAARPRSDAHRGRAARRPPRFRRLPGNRHAGGSRPSAPSLRSTSRTAADSTCRSSSASPATDSSATWSGTSSGRWSRSAPAGGTRGARWPSSNPATGRRPAGRRRRRGCF